MPGATSVPPCRSSSAWRLSWVVPLLVSPPCWQRVCRLSSLVPGGSSFPCRSFAPISKSTVASAVPRTPSATSWAVCSPRSDTPCARSPTTRPCWSTWSRSSSISMACTRSSPWQPATDRPWASIRPNWYWLCSSRSLWPSRPPSSTASSPAAWAHSI